MYMSSLERPRPLQADPVILTSFLRCVRVVKVRDSGRNQSHGSIDYRTVVMCGVR
jgi:hypothetical protein